MYHVCVSFLFKRKVLIFFFEPVLLSMTMLFLLCTVCVRLQKKYIFLLSQIFKKIAFCVRILIFDVSMFERAQVQDFFILIFFIAI